MVKILKNHTVGLASKIEKFLKVTIENPQTFEMPSTLNGPQKLKEIHLMPEPRNLEGFKATLKKTSGVYKGPFFKEHRKSSVFLAIFKIS